MAGIRIFGTDGIRGRAFEGWLSEDRVSALGRAVGLAHAPHLAAGEQPLALLGHDGRASGPVLQTALAHGLHAAGFEVKTCGLISSPGLALLTRIEPFSLGLMLSASHNPAEDNGIKIFTARGEKLSEAEELAIEELLRARPEAVAQGPEPVFDGGLESLYVEQLIARAAQALDLTGLQVVVDCANGSASHYGPLVLERLGATVTALSHNPDGKNINSGCGSTHPELLCRAVVAGAADLGIALDGDADRCILADSRGEIVHGDGILTVLARHAADKGTWNDPRIVATVMSNRGLHRALREKDVSVLEVGVGDRLVVEAMRREGLQLGGEQSGHIVFGADNHYIGDGLYTALRVIQVLIETGRSLADLAAPYQAFPQVLLNVPVCSKPELAQVAGVPQLLRLAADELGADGRILLRYSGTEPLARVMVEGPNEKRIQELARAIADRIAATIGG
jgi:phosphoglucosamine mutase